MVGTGSGFELFWQNYVLLYGAPILQMVLWAVQIVVFAYAVMLLKRWVDFATGTGETAVEPIAPAAPVKAAEEPVNVDEFVD